MWNSGLFSYLTNKFSRRKVCWEDGDSSLYIVYDDGSYIWLGEGEEFTSIRRNGISQLIHSSCSGNTIYNCGIQYDEEYETLTMCEESKPEEICSVLRKFDLVA